ncbi:hypothetical protein BH09ACT10_BH09ACT10_03760 [soil metagenome]
MVLGVITTLALITFLAAQPSSAAPGIKTQTTASTTIKTSLTGAITNAKTIGGLSQCPSGYFCVWSQSGYTGSVQRFSTTGKYIDIVIRPTLSVWNNRADRTFMHESADGSARYYCFDPRQKYYETSSWARTAEAVWLSTVENC